jgi:hypothetical protein
LAANIAHRQVRLYHGENLFCICAQYTEQKPQRKNPVRLKRWLLFVCCLGVALTAPPVVQALDAAGEYEIKAVYLFNLGNFIKWPAATLTEHFSLCVLGQNPFGENLDYVIQTEKTVQTRPVVLRYLPSHAPVNGCHVLFISMSEQAHIQGLLAQLKKSPILTVSDSEQFAAQGGMVQFYRQDNKLRLLLNRQAIEAVGLKASAHLLSIALLVQH